MKNITPFLWFDNQAEEAAKFYTSVFKNSRILDVSRYGPDTPGPEGSVMTAHIELNGQQFTLLNGGPQHFHFSEAISFYVSCDDQQEVDFLWNRLCEGGEPGPCGWLKDKYGLSWQIIPAELPALVGGPDPEKSGRAMQAMLKMSKIDLAELRQAYEGR